MSGFKTIMGCCCGPTFDAWHICINAFNYFVSGDDDGFSSTYSLEKDVNGDWVVFRTAFPTQKSAPFSHDFNSGPKLDIPVYHIPVEGVTPTCDDYVSIAMASIERYTAPYVRPDRLDFCYQDRLPSAWRGFCSWGLEMDQGPTLLSRFTEFDMNKVTTSSFDTWEGSISDTWARHGTVGLGWRKAKHISDYSGTSTPYPFQGYQYPVGNYVSPPPPPYVPAFRGRYHAGSTPYERSWDLVWHHLGWKSDLNFTNAETFRVVDLANARRTEITEFTDITVGGDSIDDGKIFTGTCTWASSSGFFTMYHGTDTPTAYILRLTWEPGTDRDVGNLAWRASIAIDAGGGATAEYFAGGSISSHTLSDTLITDTADVFYFYNPSGGPSITTNTGETVDFEFKCKDVGYPTICQT